MKEKKQIEEIQSRREFFKNATKKALPIIGAIVLSNTPIIAKVPETESLGCNTNCKIACATGCYIYCEGSCKDGCKKTCKDSCIGGCKRSCKDLSTK